MALAGLGRDSGSLESFPSSSRLGPQLRAALEAAAQIEYDAGSPEASRVLGKVSGLRST